MVAHDITDAPFLLAGMVRQEVLLRGSFDHVSHVGAVRHATQQSRGGAKLRDGNSGRSRASPKLHEDWRKHHEAELSSADRIQEV